MSKPRRGSPAVTIKLTEYGRSALASGEADRLLSPFDLLVIEVATRTENITAKHLNELVYEISAHYGSFEKALEAVRSGAVEFSRVQ